jgi:hypothetical protein
MVVVDSCMNGARMKQSKGESNVYDAQKCKSDVQKGFLVVLEKFNKKEKEKKGEDQKVIIEIDVFFLDQEYGCIDDHSGGYTKIFIGFNLSGFQKIKKFTEGQKADCKKKTEVGPFVHHHHSYHQRSPDHSCNNPLLKIIEFIQT